MIYSKKIGILLIIIFSMFSGRVYALNCEEAYLDKISENIQKCDSDAELSSSKAICDRYGTILYKCLVGTVENAYFFNLFYNSGSSVPNSLVMDEVFKSAFDEIFRSIREKSEKSRITIIGHTDLFSTKESSQFDTEGICIRANLDTNSNACLALNRSLFLHKALKKYMEEIPNNIKDTVSVDLPCYSEDFFIRNINNMLEGKVWDKFNIEAEIQDVLTNYNIHPSSFLLSRDKTSWKKIPRVSNLKDFRRRNINIPVAGSEVINYISDLGIFRTVVLIVWTGKSVNNNGLSGILHLPVDTFKG